LFVRIAAPLFNPAPLIELRAGLAAAVLLPACSDFRHCCA